MNQYIQYYRKEYEARRISRREFVGRLGAVGVAATAATSLLAASDSVLADTRSREAGCGSAGTPTARTTP